MTRHNSWRSSTAVRSALVAALVAGSGIGGYSYQTEQATSGGGNGTSTSGGETTLQAAPFTTADTGNCLTWDIAEDGTFTNFGQTDCAGEHRYEVASRENLAAYPSSEFGPKAPAPDITRQAQLREELCKGPTMEYLKGQFDPLGRYSIAPILPPAEAWNAGDRTMLCGVQVAGDNGIPMKTSGRATEQDQSRAHAAGTCVLVDASGSTRTVDCAQDHSFEVTKEVNLKEHFPEGVPTVEDQDKFLQQECTVAAQSFLGGDEALYNSTLQPFWTTINTNSWIGGSHTVNCALFKPNRAGSFSVLAGSAKGPFTIDGAAPPPQPTRNPLRQP
ncbi:putative membrane protein [Corynebacterium kalinowskii]|uniref:Membrane protein n=1 Tax=Corynebacterium kalinowskii TaxID=2675216 RepID=A0A6B8VHM9_9CORY|nr:septum formation family protein [Corynebacterium kalinowskii]QGU01104.1 putative membrane protein [Corynebacterium kalinowskii]